MMATCDQTTSRNRLVAAGLAICLAVVGCSAFNGSDSNPNVDVSDGGPDGGADNGRADGGSDGGTGGALCSSPHALCDDFNRTGSPFTSAIWGASFGDAGALASPPLATSPALVVDVGATGAGSYRLQKNLSGNFTSMHCSFRLYLEDTGSQTAGIPITLRLDGTTSYSAYLSLRQKADSRASLFIIDAPPAPQTSVDFFTLGVGTWYAIDVTVPDLHVSLNGMQKAIPATDGGAVAGPFASATVEVGLQLYANIADPGWVSALDDIVCDTK